MKRRLLIITLSLTLQVACSGGLLTGFRVGMRVTQPFVATLVTEGVISQPLADLVTADINDGIDAAVNCDKCLKAIPNAVVGAARQAGRARCYLVLAGDLRKILERHNLNGVEQLARISRIIEAGIIAFEEYARAVGAEAALVTAGVKARAAVKAEDADKKLKRSIRQFKEDLREATKSPEPGKSGKFRYLIPQEDDFLMGW